MGARTKEIRNDYKRNAKELKALHILRTQFDKTEQEYRRTHPDVKDKKLFYKYRTFNFIHRHLENKSFPTLTVDDYMEAFNLKKRSYYDWLDNEQPLRNKWDDDLESKIKAIHKTNQYFGYRIIADLLFLNYKIKTSYEKVRRYMHVLGLKGKPSPTKFDRGWRGKKRYINKQNVQKENVFHWTTRDFGKKHLISGIQYEWINTKDKFVTKHKVQKQNIVAMNEVYGSDSDYISSREEGSLRITPIIDLISKKVVNHCYWAKGEDTKVIANCLDKSLKNKNVFIFHTANDSELTSTAIKTVLKKHHVVHSLCDTGSSWENAIVESFFASLVRWTKINKSWNQKWKRNDIEQMIDEFIVQYNQLQDYRNSRKQLKDNQPQHRKFVDEYLTTVYLV